MKNLPQRRVFEPSIVDTARARLPQKNPLARHTDTGSDFKLTKGFSPVMLTSGEVRLYRGAIAIPDHGKLQPVERSAMLIDEIHISGRYKSGAVSYFDPRWAIRAKFTLGNIALSNDFLPIAGYEYAYLSNQLNTVFTHTSTDYSAQLLSSMRWKLPVPLYVPAGSVLNCQLLGTNDYFIWAEPSEIAPNGQLFADVTYIGRLLPIDYPIPKTIKVPFVTGFYTPDALSGNSVQLIQSKDLQLGNPFDVPFYAQRFVMHSFQLYILVASYLTETYDGISPITTLRGTIQDQDISIANLMRHYVVFDDGQSLGTFGTYGHRVMNLFNLELKPKDRFDLTLDWQGTTQPTYHPCGVATLVGWRNEVI